MPFPFSLLKDFSSPEPESEVEKCLEEGALVLPGVVGAWTGGVASWVVLVVELAFAAESRRD